MDLRLPPIKESGLKVSQYIKKIYFPILMTSASDQAHNLPQSMENSMLPQGIQRIEQRMRQINSREGFTPNMSRNNDDGGSDENDRNKRPPVSTSSSEPIHRTIKGNFTKYDNSVRKTNISSFNVKDNTIRNSFNSTNTLVDSSRECLCLFVSENVPRKLTWYFQFRERGNQPTSDFLAKINARGGMKMVISDIPIPSQRSTMPHLRMFAWRFRSSTM